MGDVDQMSLREWDKSIVERLRHAATATLVQLDTDLMREAADEIEKTRGTKIADDAIIRKLRERLDKADDEITRLKDMLDKAPGRDE